MGNGTRATEAGGRIRSRAPSKNTMAWGGGGVYMEDTPTLVPSQRKNQQQKMRERGGSGGLKDDKTQHVVRQTIFPNKKGKLWRGGGDDAQRRPARKWDEHTCTSKPCERIARPPSNKHPILNPQKKLSYALFPIASPCLPVILAIAFRQ